MRQRCYAWHGLQLLHWELSACSRNLSVANPLLVCVRRWTAVWIAGVPTLYAAFQSGLVPGGSAVSILEMLHVDALVDLSKINPKVSMHLLVSYTCVLYSCMPAAHAAN